MVQCRRGEVDNVRIDCTRNDVVLFVATENQSRDSQIPFDRTVNIKNFHSTFLSSGDKLSLRHGYPFFRFWTIHNDGSCAQKDPTLEYQYNRVWKFLIYVSKNDLNEETKLRYLKYLGGQGIFSVENTNYLCPLITLAVTENVVYPGTILEIKLVLGNPLGVVLKKIVSRRFAKFISVNSVT